MLSCTVPLRFLVSISVKQTEFIQILVMNVYQYISVLTIKFIYMMYTLCVSVAD